MSDARNEGATRTPGDYLSATEGKSPQRCKKQKFRMAPQLRIFVQRPHYVYESPLRQSVYTWHVIFHCLVFESATTGP